MTVNDFLIQELGRQILAQYRLDDLIRDWLLREVRGGKECDDPVDILWEEVLVRNGVSKDVALARVASRSERNLWLACHLEWGHP